MARRRGTAVPTPRPPPRSPGCRRRWQCAPASPGWQTAARVRSGDRSQPSLNSVGEKEEHDADQDDEADRRVGAGQVVALGKIVDELAEAAEIDQELNADDVDQREDHAEAQ